MRERQENIGPMPAGTHAMWHRAETSTYGSEIPNPELRLSEQDELSLGALNPLIHSPELMRKESIDALKKVCLGKIEKYGGILPTKIESKLVMSLHQNVRPDMRFIAQFEVDELPEAQLDLLESLAKETYPMKVRTRTNSDGNDIRPDRYPPSDLNDSKLSNTTGWYMGPNLLTPTDSLHKGLFVYRDLGEVNKNNFSDPKVSGSRYLVEVRESTMYQTDLVEFITQVSTILGTGKARPSGELLYEVYYDLMRMGLKKSSAHGIDEVTNTIKRSLIYPLASRDLSEGIKQQPESVLEVGVPGTGKTLAVQELLQEETGVFILPIDPFELVRELQEDKEDQTLLPRIADVSRKTGKRVVLHVDDIENMVQNEQATHSTLLNLMAGIRENNFYIIASTNDPEKIDTALLQPQRFGVLIYCGLPIPEARREILSLHTNEVSDKLEKPLFASPEMREIILDAVTRETEGFTPRYIAEIANVAKSYLLFRIAEGRKQSIGLTEEELEDYTFTAEDWIAAYREVSARYNKEQTKKRDEELRKFVTKHQRDIRGLGFSVNGSQNGHVLFSHEEFCKLSELTTGNESN